MDFFFLLLALICGVALGCGFALMIVGFVLMSSNKMGDSKGDFKNFAGNSMRFITKRNL